MITLGNTVTLTLPRRCESNRQKHLDCFSQTRLAISSTSILYIQDYCDELLIFKIAISKRLIISTIDKLGVLIFTNIICDNIMLLEESLGIMLILWDDVI